MKPVHFSIFLAATILIGLSAHQLLATQPEVVAHAAAPVTSKLPFPAGPMPASAPIRRAERPVPDEPLPTSFNSAKDLWKFAQGALQSNSEAQVHEGYMAAKECFGLSAIWSEYSNFASGSPSPRVSGVLTPERQVAIQALAEKCGGFLLAGKAKTLELVRALDHRQKQLGGSLSAAEKSIDIPASAPAAVTRLLLSGSPSAVEAGLAGLPEIWAQAHKIAPSDPRVEQMSMASLLAACNLGKDCGAGSYSAQLLCAMQGDCSGGLWHHWSDSMAPDQIQGINQLREAIESAVKAGDLSQIGIVAPRGTGS
ncbi:hypothetical protein [Roseateles depolymerans]|uniref:Uncharacterized protein n=1 Tax=Roseateles depolymerans TaxID=76731 RepID=A0A0U3ML17_9BURK|nr:hypothetical protein [Roseateles depolymerans]ALV09193.1 hypothetical protein RD2015_4755 [Roseateles depolymerans]REG13950.1 hypothetical protein DES44_3961 [Roseateles depolymerans]